VSGPRTPRRRARRRAFQILYGFGFDAPVSDRGLLKAVKDAPEEPGMPEESGDGYALELVKGVWSAHEDLDRLIQANSQNWKLARIAKVELTILRLGAYEMLHVADIPLRVALNEAVELAKEFGDDNSAGFVNGVLDAVAKAVDQGRLGVTKALTSTKEEA